ncbi:MAG: hypothetical protein H6686_10810 [Fibrobacteria bacterium]|nr:hypothetical protein [Fibrobacteria bacterium]
MATRFLDRLRTNPFPGENRNDHPDLRRIPSILLGLGLYQVVGMLGTTAMFLVGSVFIVDLSEGDSRWGGAPIASVLLASAGSALFFSRRRSRWGVRGILLAASVLGVAAGLLAVWAVLARSVEMFLGACLLVGASNGGIQLSRYAAGELAPPGGRGRAMSVVMTSATLGALLSPFLANLALEMASGLNLVKEVGPFALVAVVWGIMGFLGRALVSREGSRIAAVADWRVPPAGSSGPAEKADASTRSLLVSFGALVFGQAAMVFLMSIAPAHMRTCHYPMSQISFAITVHSVGMYALSFLTGILIDRLGNSRVILAGSLTMVAACLVGWRWEGLEGRLAYLFLLGYGWNLCFLSGSVLMANALRGGRPPSLQGNADALVALSAAAASLASGLVLQGYGFGALISLGVLLSAAPLLILFGTGAVRFRPRARDPEWTTAD